MSIYRVVELHRDKANTLYALVRQGMVLGKVFTSYCEAVEHVCERLDGMVDTGTYVYRRIA